MSDLDTEAWIEISGKEFQRLDSYPADTLVCILNERLLLYVWLMRELKGHSPLDSYNGKPVIEGTGKHADGTAPVHCRGRKAVRTTCCMQ